MARGNFSAATIRELMVRSGGRCSRPDCGRTTLGPSKTLTERGQVLGEAAHIRAASPGGARYDSTQSEAERHAAGNGIWLCERCAELIDKNNGADFSVSEIQMWKLASEKAALSKLNASSDSVKENCIESLIFINLPRLRQYAVLSNQPIWQSTPFDDGIPGEGYIAPELHQIERMVACLHFPSLDWKETADLVDDPSGMIVSFEGNFRTKNGPRGRDDRRERDFSDLSTAPQVYEKLGNLKLLLPYDPKYVTTSTAAVELTSGRIRIGGFAQIKKREDNIIIASPFIIGLASTQQARAFWNAVRAHQRG